MYVLYIYATGYCVLRVAKSTVFLARFMMLPEHRNISLLLHFYWMSMRDANNIIDWKYTIYKFKTKSKQNANSELLVIKYHSIRNFGKVKILFGEWKSRTNRELEEMSKGKNIVKWIKGQRISCLGHLERMEEDRMPKKTFIQKLEGTRRRGRPRKRWKEEAERDLQVLGVRRWRELAADRKKWKDIVRQAKVHSRL